MLYINDKNVLWQCRIIFSYTQVACLSLRLLVFFLWFSWEGEGGIEVWQYRAMAAWQFLESRVLVLSFDWIIKIENFTSASKICQKRHLFPQLRKHDCWNYCNISTSNESSLNLDTVALSSKKIERTENPFTDFHQKLDH